MTADRTGSHTSVACRGAIIEIAGLTDRGTVREQNQDVWAYTPSRDGSRWVLLLADGMGGHRGGLESARAAVDGALASVSQHDNPSVALRDIVAAASRGVATVRESIGGDPGTTLVMAVLDGDRATIANVGDSRAYVVGVDGAFPITTDHSWTAEQVAQGRLSEAEARRDRRRNIITRAVLGDPVEPDVFEVPLEARQTLLLCSDGLWEPLADRRLAAALSEAGSLADGLERACDAALTAGSTDNVTLVAARIRPQPGSG